MTSKAKLEAKQSARAEKLFDDVVNGGQKVYSYVGQKSQPQSNRKGGGLDLAGENSMAYDYIRLLIILLPGGLAKLATLKDPRIEKMCDHSLGTLLIYGFVMFLSSMASRRAANREISGEAAHQMISQVIPGLETIPHADTLARLLERVDADEMEQGYEAMAIEFIKSSVFRKINPGRVLVAADGTVKFSRKYCFDERALTRRIGDDAVLYYVYALESVIILDNGIVLPLFTEILENEGKKLGDTTKQDCEQKAFYRLTEKMKKYLGMGCVTILVDGLYACGPIVSRCNSLGWEYMITLKRGSLQSVWEDFEGLCKCEPDNTLICKTDNDRKQTFHWANKIEYTYGGNNKRIYLNVVTCLEEWIEPHSRSGKKEEYKTCEWAWLSSTKVSAGNVVHLCNDLGRKRWRILSEAFFYAHLFIRNQNFTGNDNDSEIKRCA